MAPDVNGWITIGIFGGIMLAYKPVEQALKTAAEKILMDKKEFIKKMAVAAQPVNKETGIPMTVMVAQAAHESNWGRSQLARDGNNLFGIKAGPGWIGPTITLPTYEIVNGKEIKVDAAFRKYSSWEASVRDWVKFIHGPRYAKALAAALAQKTNEFFYELQRAGYATDPKYGEKLTAVHDSIRTAIA